MGFRFRRRIKIAKGVNVNLSKSGASVTAGGRGVTMNSRKKGVRVTQKLPGGFSITNILFGKKKRKR